MLGIGRYLRNLFHARLHPFGEAFQRKSLPEGVTRMRQNSSSSFSFIHLGASYPYCPSHPTIYLGWLEADDGLVCLRNHVIPTILRLFLVLFVCLYSLSKRCVFNSNGLFTRMSICLKIYIINGKGAPLILLLRRTINKRECDRNVCIIECDQGIGCKLLHLL